MNLDTFVDAYYKHTSSMDPSHLAPSVFDAPLTFASSKELVFRSMGAIYTGLDELHWDTADIAKALRDLHDSHNPPEHPDIQSELESELTKNLRRYLIATRIQQDVTSWVKSTKEAFDETASGTPSGGEVSLKLLNGFESELKRYEDRGGIVKDTPVTLADLSDWINEQAKKFIGRVLKAAPKVHGADQGSVQETQPSLRPLSEFRNEIPSTDKGEAVENWPSTVPKFTVRKEGPGSKILGLIRNLRQA